MIPSRSSSITENSRKSVQILLLCKVATFLAIYIDRRKRMRARYARYWTFTTRLPVLLLFTLHFIETNKCESKLVENSHSIIKIHYFCLLLCLFLQKPKTKTYIADAKDDVGRFWVTNIWTLTVGLLVQCPRFRSEEFSLQTSTTRTRLHFRVQQKAFQ